MSADPRSCLIGCDPLRPARQQIVFSFTGRATGASRVPPGPACDASAAIEVSNMAAII
jgi:hypothetical protein